MEERVSALERAVQRIDAKLDRLVERVSRLPGKGFFVKLCLSGLGALVALSVLTTLLQGKLQTLFGLAH